MGFRAQVRVRVRARVRVKVRAKARVITRERIRRVRLLRSRTGVITRGGAAYRGDNQGTHPACPAPPTQREASAWLGVRGRGRG